MYDEDIERYDALMELLTEIRDALRPPPRDITAPWMRGPASLWGYVHGSGATPTQSQVALAKSMLDGSMFAEFGPRNMPTAARDIAREIVHESQRTAPTTDHNAT